MPGPGEVPTQGCAKYHWEATPAAIGRELGLLSAGDGNAGSRVQIDGGVCAEETEYGRVIHCNAKNYGPLRGDGTDAGDVVGKMWWEQEGLDLAGSREAAEAADEERGG